MRCFIALPLPPEARDFLAREASALRKRLAQSFVTPKPSALSWTRSEGYHLTLAFLGEIEGRALEVAAAALDVALGFGDIAFSFEGLGTFPPRGAWRVLYARIADEGRASELCSLVNGELAVGAATAGLRPLNPEWPSREPGEAGYRSGPGARPFSAHITLARAKEGRSPSLPRAASRAIPLLTERPSGKWTITRCALYKSELRSSGAVYTELRGVDIAHCGNPPHAGGPAVGV